MSPREGDFRLPVPGSVREQRAVSTAGPGSSKMGVVKCVVLSTPCCSALAGLTGNGAGPNLVYHVSMKTCLERC